MAGTDLVTGNILGKKQTKPPCCLHGTHILVWRDRQQTINNNITNKYILVVDNGYKIKRARQRGPGELEEELQFLEG